MPKKDFKFHFPLRVRWIECDAQGIVFNGAYMIFIEAAQAEYYRNLGILLYDENSRKHFDVATVKATLEYKASAQVDEILEIYMRALGIGNTSITMEVEMYRQDSDELVHKAEVIYVDYDSEESTARRVPDDVRELINHYEQTGEVLSIQGFPP